MYLNPTYQNQRGFLIPLALFIVVVMGMFSLVLARNTVQTSNSVTLELSSTQAFYMAESGVQNGMQKLFFPDPRVRATVDGRCANSFPVTFTFNVTGLKNCSTTVTCSCVYQDQTSCSATTSANYSTSAATAKLTSFYKISSAATCGSNTFSAARTIEASAFLKQE